MLNETLTFKGWQFYSVEFTLPAGANELDIRENLNDRGIYIDDVTFSMEQDISFVPDTGSTLLLFIPAVGSLLVLAGQPKTKPQSFGGLAEPYLETPN